MRLKGVAQTIHGAPPGKLNARRTRPALETSSSSFCCVREEALLLLHGAEMWELSTGHPGAVVSLAPTQLSGRVFPTGPPSAGKARLVAPPQGLLCCVHVPARQATHSAVHSLRPTAGA